MSRELKTKELVNMRLAANYGGWIYCDNCQTNIGYLCYVTYDKFQLNFTCNCGEQGSCLLEFKETAQQEKSDKAFLTIKNRCCCPNDESPLFTILDQKLKSYKVIVSCANCEETFEKTKEIH